MTVAALQLGRLADCPAVLKKISATSAVSVRRDVPGGKRRAGTGLTGADAELGGRLLEDLLVVELPELLGRVLAARLEEDLLAACSVMRGALQVSESKVEGSRRKR